jgi:hypothetical protein
MMMRIEYNKKTFITWLLQDMTRQIQ